MKKNGHKIFVTIICLIVSILISPAIADDQAGISKSAAFQAVLQDVLDGSMEGKWVYVAREAVKAEAEIKAFNKTVKSPPFEGWFFFIDDHPWANWEHPCRYVFVNGATGEYRIIPARMPPDNIQQMERLTPIDTKKKVNLFNLKSLPEKNISSCSSPENLYAVIISGGYNSYNNWVRYWNDCAAIYSTLTQVYGYLDDHIYVIMSDGTDPGLDRHHYDDTYDSSPLDLDDDGDDDIQYSATKTNIAAVFNTLQGILGPDDSLFIYSTDHGSQEAGQDALLLLWGESIRDDEFALEVNKINCGEIVVVMEQCYSGGFVDDLSAQGRVIATACRYDEPSWAMPPDYTYDEFVYYWTAAVRGETPEGTPVDADSDGDGNISMEEAFIYARDHDSANEHPQYDCNPIELGAEVSLCGLISPEAESPPTVMWQTTFDDPEVRAVAVDSDNNIIVTGDSYTAKFDPAGDELWTVEYSDYADYATFRGVAVDSDNNIIVAGDVGHDDHDVLIVKYSPQGDMLGTWMFDFDDYNDRAHGVAVDSSGNIIAVGRSRQRESPWVERWIVLKCNSSADELWRDVYSYTYGSDEANAVAIDSNDNVIVTGKSKVSGGFYPDNQMLTMKYDPAGNRLWHKKYGTEDPAYGQDNCGNTVVVDSENNVIVAGYAEAPDDKEVIKYSPGGSIIWERDYPTIISSTVTPQDDIVVASDDRIFKLTFGGGAVWEAPYEAGYEITSVVIDFFEDFIAAGHNDQGIIVKYSSPTGPVITDPDVESDSSHDCNGDTYTWSAQVTDSDGDELTVELHLLGLGDLNQNGYLDMGDLIDIINYWSGVVPIPDDPLIRRILDINANGLIGPEDDFDVLLAVDIEAQGGWLVEPLDESGATYTFSRPLLNIGPAEDEYQWKITADDGLNQISTETFVGPEVRINPDLTLHPPQVECLTVRINGVVHCIAEALDWDWGDGTPIERNWFPATHTYEKEGTYTVTVTAYGDDEGKTEKTVVVSVPPCGCSCDINGDGEVTPQDALCAFQKYLGICPTSCGPCEEICCDVTMDDDCTPADALEIFKDYLGIYPNVCSPEPV